MLEAEARVRLIDAGRRLAGALPGAWDRRLRELGKVVLDYRGARKTAGRALAFPGLRRHSTLVAVPFGRGQLLVDTRDDEIGRVVYATGGYERIYMETAVGFLACCGLPTAGKVFADVGANIGTSTVDALLEFGFARAVCFEPESHNFRLLRMNLVLNDLEDRATAHRLALSDADGRSFLRRSPKNSGDHRVVAPPEHEPATPPDGSWEEVECVRLDSLVEGGALDPSELGLVWIDAQGHEAQVLAGARTVVEAGVPVVLEYWPEALGDSLAGLEELIEGYYTSVVDLRLLAQGVQDAAVLEAGDLLQLRRRYAGRGLTDLLLVR